MSSITTYEAFESTSPVKQEKFLLGYVNGGYTAKNPAEFGIDGLHAPQQIWEVDIDDPYVQARDPHERMEVRSIEAEADNYAHARRLNGLWERKPGTTYVTENGEEQKKDKWGDPESRDRFFGRLGSEALNLWQSELIPTAKALAYLAEPIGLDTVESLDGSHSVPLDETAKKWFSLCTDAIGIRSRATVMSEAIKNYIDLTREAGKSPDDLNWMSIACGTALPTLKAAVAANIAPNLHLVDFNEKILESTTQLAEELSFEGEIKTYRANIFDRKQMLMLRDKLKSEDKLPDVIDLMGIFEYTGENINVDPALFLRTAYDFLKPGGRLIFGQMRSDRPMSDFTMGVVSWGFIHMRSPAEVMEVVRNAGILPEQTRLFLPKDSVYTVGVIDKPSLDSEELGALELL